MEIVERAGGASGKSGMGTYAYAVSVYAAWSEKRLEARDVMQFPWDGNKKGRSEERPESKDEIMSRYRAAKKAFGMK